MNGGTDCCEGKINGLLHLIGTVNSGADSDSRSARAAGSLSGEDDRGVLQDGIGS